MSITRSIARPITRPLARPLTAAGVGGGFDPVDALFGNGEGGALLWTTLSPMFQDSGATTPATAATDPVGYLGDLSPNGNHATQADAARPPLAEDAGGLYLNPDGTNHWLDFGTEIIGIDGVRTIAFTGLIATTPTGTRGAIGCTVASGFLGRVSGKWAFRSNTGITHSSDIDALTEETIVVRLDGTNIRITDSAGTESFADSSTYGQISRLLCSSGTSGRMAGKARGFLIIDRVLTDDEVAAYRAWAASQAGFLPLVNPYAQADWSGEQVASMMHAHTTAKADFDGLVAAGYQHLAISNYYASDPATSYPLTNLTGVTEGDIPADVVGCPNAEHFGFTDMSGHMAAVGSLLKTGTTPAENPPDGGGADMPWREFFDAAIDDMQHPNAGGLIFTHPLLSYAGDPAAKAGLDYNRHVLGLEVWSHLAEWNYGGKGFAGASWHSILASGRRCFGFGAPDHYEAGVDPPATGYTMLVLPAEYATASTADKERLCQEAYYAGRCYVKRALTSPTLTNVQANTSSVTVTFDAPCDIHFVYAKRGDAAASETSPVTGTSATYTRDGTEVYVRAVAQGAETDETTWVQPIRFGVHE